MPKRPASGQGWPVDGPRSGCGAQGTLSSRFFFCDERAQTPGRRFLPTSWRCCQEVGRRRRKTSSRYQEDLARAQARLLTFQTPIRRNALRILRPSLPQPWQRIARLGPAMQFTAFIASYELAEASCPIRRNAVRLLRPTPAKSTQVFARRSELWLCCLKIPSENLRRNFDDGFEYIAFHQRMIHQLKIEWYQALQDMQPFRSCWKRVLLYSIAQFRAQQRECARNLSKEQRRLRPQLLPPTSHHTNL